MTMLRTMKKRVARALAAEDGMAVVEVISTCLYA